MAPLFACLLLQTSDAATTVRAYVEALTNGDLKAAAGLVQGGEYSDAARRLAGYLAMMKGKSPLVKLLDVKATESGDAATADVRITTFQGEEDDTLSLTKLPAGWRIVPRAVDPMKPKLLDGLTLGFVQPLVFLAIVVPIEAQKKRHEDLLAIKKAGTALIIWLGDHDERFPKATADLGALLAPYLKDKDLAARITKKEWLLNDALAGRSDDEIDDPSKVVMLYEATGGKSGPGFGGRKLVVFADGSAFLADAAKLKASRWTIKARP